MRPCVLPLVAGAVVFALAASGGCGGSSSSRSSSNQGPIQCGETILGNLPSGAGTPIQITNPAAVRHFHITNVGAGTGAIQIDLLASTGNVDLYLGAPGTPVGDADPLSYYFTSQSSGPAESLLIGSTGVTNLAGTVDSTFNLGDFIAAGTAPVFLVAAAAAPTNFSAQVTCYPPPAATTPLACWGRSTGTVPGSLFAVLPDFSDPGETDFYELPLLSSTTEEVILDLSITSGDAHLGLAAPGATPGSLIPGDYVVCACGAGDDQIVMTLGGISDGGGTLVPGLSLTNYLAASTPISFIVMGYSASTTYDVAVSCYDPASPPTPASPSRIDCATQVTGSVPGSLSPVLPIFTDLSESVFYEVPPFAPTVTEVILDLSMTSGDAHLYLAAPGATPGSLVRGDYIIWSAEAGGDRLTIDNSGVTDILGGLFTNATLADYIAAGTPVSFIVAGFDPTSDYSLTVTCCDPSGPILRDISCGTTLRGVSLEGWGLSQPDFRNCRRNHFYRITSIPPGTENLEIRSSTTAGGGDTDVYLLDVGLAPGSTNLGDYVYNSRSGGPFGANTEDLVSVMPAGIASFFKSSDTPTLVDYVNSGVEMSFVVTGRASQSSYDLSLICDTTPRQTPVTIACGGSDSGSLVGKFLTPPDYNDPAEVTFYEIDAATLPVGVTSIDIGVDTTSGDCDFFLAAPGTTPGIPAIIHESVQSMTTPDGVIIDATGITGYPGGQGRTSTLWNLNDYLNAPTNISFVVQSWELASDYTVTVTCN